MQQTGEGYWIIGIFATVTLQLGSVCMKNKYKTLHINFFFVDSDRKLMNAELQETV